MPHMQFVILEHQTENGTHWDLMFEEEPDAPLTTFSFPPQKIDEAGSLSSFRSEARNLPPHRNEYLNYEGEISGKRGNVKRIAAGVFEKTSENCYILKSDMFHGILAVENHGEVTELFYDALKKRRGYPRRFKRKDKVKQCFD
ncbi:MAG: hypothetical protein FWE67_15795 [Planctomycetaceae bacterium]|nr:hypothetical protein [Planctomycetaceae bacterium]